jgi:GNAT superfamily N-acetyltransferase
MSDDTHELPGQETLLACWCALAALSPEARLVETGGAIAAVFPSWAPLNNAILPAGSDPGAESTAVAALRELYEEAAVPVWALWRPTRTADLDATDGAAPIEELKRDTTTLVMQTALHPALPQHRAVVRASIADVARFDADVRLHASDLANPEAAPGLSGWVLLENDLVVCAAWSFVHGTDCGVYGVETLPRLRRRGFARTLVQHLLAEARRQGATTASLQSTREGQRLYASLGFAAVGRYEEWIWQ